VVVGESRSGQLCADGAAFFTIKIDEFVALTGE
jgi:hypothetical protein